MSFDFADVILLPFPFTNQFESKKRPAVVISPRAYNIAKPDVIVMAVTSQLRPTATLGEVWLEAWQLAGLLRPSAVKPVIATLEQSLVIRQLGKLEPLDRSALRRALNTIIGPTDRDPPRSPG